MRSAITVLGILVVASGCATSSRATELRDQVRIRREVKWSAQWKAAQEKSDLWRYRLELCFSAREGADTTPMTMAEVEAACAADVRTMESTATRDARAELLATRWARDVLNDPRLALVFACRSSDSSPDDAQAHLACADQQLQAHLWSQAKVSLLAAFARGSAEQKCLVVKNIDEHSPAPGQDAASLDLETVRRCRTITGQVTPTPAAPLAAPPRVSAAPAQSAPADAPVPADARGTSSPPPPPPARPVVVAPAREEKVTPGLQLNGDLGLGTQGVSGEVAVGYGTARFALSLTPGFSYASAGRGGARASALSLGISGRFYLSERIAKELAVYLRPELVLGSATTAVGTLENSTVFVGLGAAAGGEYLVTPRLGVTLELGVRLRLLPENDAVEFGTSAAIGVVLHQ
ncbi:MAG: hypothetical protein Q8L48_39960 [Archangium sp.]|nr:hypothetical protein [Archangium sp.]